MDTLQVSGYSKQNWKLLVLGIFLILQVEKSYAQTETLCNYDGKGVDSCERLSIRCVRGLINIVDIWYSKCYNKKSCGECCGSASKPAVKDMNAFFKKLCNDHELCSLDQMDRDNLWTANVTYICKGMQTGDITTATTAKHTGPPIISKFHEKDNEVSTVAVAVSVPIAIIVIGTLIVITMCILRKRREDKQRETNPNNQASASDSHQTYNVSFPDSNENIGVGKQRRVSGSDSSEYVEIQEVISNDNTDEYNKLNFNPVIVPVSDGYGRLPRQERVTDNTYSHIKGNLSNNRNDTPTGTIESIEEDGDYNHTNVAWSVQQTGNRGQSDEYDTSANCIETNFGTPLAINTNSSDAKSNQIRNEYSKLDISNERNVQTNGDGKTTHTDHNYLVIVKDESEKEEQTGADAATPNNYFILEKSN